MRRRKAGMSNFQEPLFGVFFWVYSNAISWRKFAETGKGDRAPTPTGAGKHAGRNRRANFAPLGNTGILDRLAPPHGPSWGAQNQLA